MRKNIWEKRIPTLLGIILLIIGITATSFLTKSGIIYFGKASPSYTPENVRIANLTDTSFTVSYTTKDSVLGSINLGENKDNLSNSYLDDRDQQSNNVTLHRMHYITIRNLKPSTKYFFNIVSEQNIFYNNDQPFEATTAKTTTGEPSSQNPIVGKVLLPDGSAPTEAIILLTTENAQSLSTMVKTDGSYILPLNSILNKTLTSYLTFSPESIIKMLALDPLYQSQIIILAKQINPVPPIMLSKNYDFTNNATPNLSETPTPPSVQSSFPTFSANPAQSKEPQILTPKKDESFSDQQPLFNGVASPSAKIKISIHSQEVNAEIIADNAGKWSFRPLEKLAPGQHTISITTFDKFGILKTITQSFYVYASGTQVSGNATPSATPIITFTPTPTAKLTPTNALTPSPILTLNPTLLITLSPTPYPTITPTPTLSPTPTLFAAKPTVPMEPTGNSSAIITGIAALVLSALGVLLFFVTRGSISL